MKRYLKLPFCIIKECFNINHYVFLVFILIVDLILSSFLPENVQTFLTHFTGGFTLVFNTWIALFLLATKTKKNKQLKQLKLDIVICGFMTAFFYTLYLFVNIHPSFKVYFENIIPLHLFSSRGFDFITTFWCYISFKLFKISRDNVT